MSEREKAYIDVIVHLYHREDFKTFLHEVRRNNHNTLSGLSLDSITDQVKSIIESYEKGRGPSSAHGGGKGANGGNNGKGGAGKGRQNKSKAASRQQQQVCVVLWMAV